MNEDPTKSPIFSGPTSVHHHYGLLGGLMKGAIGGFMSSMFYLGVGALFHAWQLGPTFNRASMWSWGWLLAWPVAVVAISLKWIAIGLGVLLAICLVAWLGVVIFLTIRNRIRYSKLPAEVRRAAATFRSSQPIP